MKKAIIFLIVLFIFGIPKKAISAETPFFIETFDGVFGSYVELLLYTEEQEIHKEEIEKILFFYDKMTNNKENSTLDIKNSVYYLNNSVNKEIEISKEFYDLLKLCEVYNKETNGYFDITIGLVIDIWKEGISNYYKKEMPQEIFNNLIRNKDQAVALMPKNYNERLSLRVDSENTKYYAKISEGVKLDLGAIAKGYAIEKVVEYLQKNNQKYYRLDGGSSSLHFGALPNEESFNVVLRNPHSIFEGYGEIKNINDASIGTSGSDMQYFVYQGVRYHHIISPISFVPENNYYSVTVKTTDSAYSEVLTTSFFSMSLEELIAVSNQKGLFTVCYKSNNEVFFSGEAENDFVLYDSWTIPETTEKIAYGIYIIITLIVIVAIVALVITIRLTYLFYKANKKGIKRDLPMILGLSLLIVAIFGVFKLFPRTAKEYVRVYYNSLKVAEISFNNPSSPVTLYEVQDYPMPVHDAENQTITFYAIFNSGGHDFVIKYNIANRSVMVIESNCPDQYCLKQGASTYEPIVCLPNKIIIEFED